MNGTNRALGRLSERMHRLVPFRWSALAVALLLGCTSVFRAPTDQPASDLVVSNQTSLVVTLAVNGASVRSISPHSQETVHPNDLPRLPWAVEARTASDRVLAAMMVWAGDVWETHTPDGGGQMKGDAVRVDLSCGRLEMWSGPPLAGPPPEPGKPGDCD
jgi:hypothetical protein